MKPIRICPGCGSPIPPDAPVALCPQCLLKNSTVPADREGPGASASHRPVPVPGQTLGGYVIIRLLGRGGMGEVYEAEHVTTGRRVALKVMSQKLTSEDDRRRFLREGRLAASVNHPNVVYVYGSEEIEGAPVIAMELVQGGTLKDQLKRDGPLPVTQAVEAILQVIAGLEAAQAAGVLHRDIKPANCFVDPDGAIKVGDFGLSVSTFARGESFITAAGSVMGTPAYASPEQLRGQPLDVATDIYSIGATLYHLLTGQPPFHETDFVKMVTEVLDKQPPSPCQLRDGIPDDLSRILVRCLAKDRGARYQTYGQLRDALLPFRATEIVPAPPARRILANILDDSLAFTPGFLYVGYWGLDPLEAMMRERTLTAALVWLGCYVWYALYYAIWEGRTGAAVGKFLCGLRVARLDGQVSGFALALYRVVLFSLPNVLPYFLLMAFMPLARMNATLANGGTLITDQIWFLPFLLLFVTMRRRNGYAAIHDLLTRTRVVVSPKSQPRPTLVETAVAPMAGAEPAPLPYSTLGPYQIRAMLWKTPQAGLLDAFDSALRRRIWIHLRPSSEEPIAADRRDLNRPARLRWLNGGRTETHLWDAYEAGDGTPFLKLRGKPQPWSSVRFWLLDLAEEIAAALKQGTALPVLSLNRLWISRHGRAFILDFPCPGLDNEPNETLPDPLRNEADMQRFLDTVAGEALTMGKNKPAVPLHARDFLQSLERGSFPEPEFIVGNLQSLVSKPGRITPHWRAASLALAPAIMVGFAVIAVAAGFAQFRWQRQWTALYPGLPSLRAAATLYDRQVSCHKGKNSQNDLELARVYLASHFGQLLTNDAFWANQALTEDFDGAELRAELRQAVSGPKPTPQMSREADTVMAPRINFVQRSELGIVFLGTLILLAGMFSLIELFGAIFFGQSPVLSLFGIVIVDRQNGPAGRLRLFWRWTIKWIPFGALGVVGSCCLMIDAGFVSPAPPASAEQIITFTGIIASSVAVAAILACLAHTVFHPERSLADRLAGTRLAPK